MIISFSRHGESQANVKNVFSNHGRKHPLTEHGIQQVEKLASSLSTSGISKIYTSPLLRATQTAEIIAKWLELPISVEPGLREFDCGVFEDLAITPAAVEIYHAVMRRWAYGDKSSRLTGGESLQEIENRFFTFIDRVVTTHNPDDHLLCIGHGGLFTAVFPALFENISFDFTLNCEIGYAEIIRGEYRVSRWVCTGWGAIQDTMTDGE